MSEEIHIEIQEPWDEADASIEGGGAEAGAAEATWIVADYLDVVLHLFTPETRGFYRLEELWAAAVPLVRMQ